MNLHIFNFKKGVGSVIEIINGRRNEEVIAGFDNTDTNTEKRLKTGMAPVQG